MRGLFIIVFSIFCALSWGQTDIQYPNKALRKVLQKEGVPDFSEISEIPLNDSIKRYFRVQGKFFIINSEVSQFRYIYTGRVNTCRANGCAISVDRTKERKSEYFDYFILFDENKTVQLVKVFNYQATHGHEITSKGWLKQFIGHDGSKPLQVDKNIDAISGATISVYAITIDVEMKSTVLKTILPEI